LQLDKEVLSSIFDGIISSAKKEAEKDPLHLALVTYFESKKQWMDDPSSAHLMVYHNINMMMESIVDAVVPGADWLVHELYINHSFYDSNLSELCSKYFGGACSVDRSNYIIRSAIKWRTEGVVPVFTDNYWCPPKGQPISWLNIVEGLGNLRYGKPEKYLKSLQILMFEINQNDNIERFKDY